MYDEIKKIVIEQNRRKVKQTKRKEIKKFI